MYLGGGASAESEGRVRGAGPLLEAPSCTRPHAMASGARSDRPGDVKAAEAHGQGAAATGASQGAWGRGGAHFFLSGMCSPLSQAQTMSKELSGKSMANASMTWKLALPRPRSAARAVARATSTPSAGVSNEQHLESVGFQSSQLRTPPSAAQRPRAGV